MAASALTTNPSRRHVGMATAAAPVFDTGETIAAANETEILRLFREHRAIRAAASAYLYTGDPETEDETMEILFYRRADLIEAAKMLVAHGAPSLELSCLRWDDPVWVEARELTGVSA